VVPAREGLRRYISALLNFCWGVGEVVPAREGLRLSDNITRISAYKSEKWFQQEKD